MGRRRVSCCLVARAAQQNVIGTMKSDFEVCPKCEKEGVSPWAPLFASWPFYARCKSCGARLRTKIPHWQNALAQILSQFAFWVLLIYGAIQGGSLGILVGGILGALVGLVIALIPGFFSKLEALPE